MSDDAGRVSGRPAQNSTVLPSIHEAKAVSGLKFSCVELLTGSEGQDWFLFNHDSDGGVTDRATDMKTFEAMFAEDIDFITGP